jgi:hypothetical protein
MSSILPARFIEKLSENFEMQFNFGLKSALTPALSPRRGRNGFRCSQEPRVRVAENCAKVKLIAKATRFIIFRQSLRMWPDRFNG